MSLARLLLLLGTLAVAATASAQHELEGTLFTSPEQRAYLDYLRAEFLRRSQERGFDISTTEIPDIPVDAEDESAAAVEVYSLAGIVTLRDGTRRIWLNGEALAEAQLPANARLVLDGGALALRFDSTSGSHLLKPGQTLDLGSGVIGDSHALRASESAAAAGPLSNPDAPDTTAPAAAASGPGAATAGMSLLALPELTEGLRQLAPQQAAELLQALQQLQSEGGHDAE